MQQSLPLPRCGFLGMLHMDIIQERLEREYDVGLVITAPSVKYRVYMGNDSMQEITAATQVEDWTQVRRCEEPWTRAEVIVPDEYIGAVMEMCNNRRGVFGTMQHVGGGRSQVVYEIPLMELIQGFFDDLKSRTRG